MDENRSKEQELTPVCSTASPWFRWAIARAWEDKYVTVDGSPIHYLAWGETGNPCLIFVHGGGAHAHWWTHVAAYFEKSHRVLSVDLSGHGDSGWREEYSFEQWADEILAVASAERSSGPAVVIGHSMGGLVAIVAAAKYGDRLAAVIVGDTPLILDDESIRGLRSKFRSSRAYRSVDEAVAAFHTVPSQENDLDYVIDFVARHSLRATDDGWRWKYDVRVFSHSRSAALRYLPLIGTHCAFMCFEKGLLKPETAERMAATFGLGPVVTIPEAGHHAMLDQPLPLVASIVALLSQWSFPDRSE